MITDSELLKPKPLKVCRKYLDYSDVVFDTNKWADASKFLPADFDLCYLKTKEKIIPGWHTGFAWDGLNIKENVEVLKWKLNYDT